MLYLKQSTSVTLKIGPFIDDTDGKSVEAGLTEHQADIRISKNGANIIQKNEASSCTYDELGIYDCPIDDTDTNTLGRLQLWCHEAGFLPVFHEYTVLAANVFDALVGGGDYLDVATAELANIDFSATQKTSLDTIGDTVVTNSTIHTDVATAITDIATLQADVGDASASTLGSIYGILGDPAANAIKTTVEDIHTDVGTAITNIGDIHTDVGTAITNIGTVGGYVDTEVAAIKAVTDTLTLNAIADAVHDEATEGAVTLRQSIRLMLAALAGKSSGGGTNDIRFRNQADTTDRIRATVDVNGNRTAMVYDP